MKQKTFCNPVRKSPISRAYTLDLNIPFEKPELAIYSQVERLNQGGQPSWDNPDIDTYRGSTEKEIRIIDEIKARIRNLSSVAPATNAIIHCDIGAFGIGISTTRLSSQIVNVMPSQQIEVSFPLPSHILNGEQRIAVHINVELPSDLNQINNFGSQIVFGGYSSVISRDPVFEFPVVNTTGNPMNCTLSTLQNELSATVEPQSFSLAPMEQIQAKLFCKVHEAVHPEPSSVQRMEITLICRKESGELYGGLSFFILVDD